MIPCICKSFIQRHFIFLIYITTSAATHICVIGAYAEESDLFHLLAKRQSAVVLQQDHSFRSGFTGHLRMGCKIRLIGVLVTLEGGTHHRNPENVGNRLVKKALIHTAAPYGRHQLIILVLCPRHQEVVSGRNLSCAVFLGPPVGHHNALEAPIVPEDFVQEPVAFGSENTVDSIIGAHERPGLRLADHHLKGLQIDFPGGALADENVDAIAVGLLVVDGKMLHRNAHTIALDTIHISRCDSPCQIRIL